MSSSLQRHSLLLVTVLVLAVWLPAASADSHWVEVKSPHFSVVTDAGEKHGREVAIRFEQMRSVFGALMVKAHVELPVPLQIVAFRNSKEFRQIAPLWHGKPVQDAGLFMGAGTFSCEWKNRKAGINYRETGPTAGTVVSAEVQ